MKQELYQNSLFFIYSNTNVTKVKIKPLTVSILYKFS